MHAWRAGLHEPLRTMQTLKLMHMLDRANDFHKYQKVLLTNSLSSFVERANNVERLHAPVHA